MPPLIPNLLDAHDRIPEITVYGPGAPKELKMIPENVIKEGEF